RHNVVARMVNTFDIAKGKKLASLEQLLKKFAFQTMASVLKKQQNRYRDTATAPLQVVSEVLGPQFALQYVVERMEQYPARLEATWENRWQTFGFELAKRRHETAAARIHIAGL